MKIKNVLKKIKLRTLIILLLLLVFNAYAWFIYATRVTMSLSAHVVSWNVRFQAGDEEITEKVEFEVGRIYPGMDTYTQEINVENTGELSAKLTYEIKSLKILDEYYEVGEDLTEDELKDKISEYPFKIKIDKSKDELEAENGQATFTISVEWPYESGDDKLDTSWGEKAYEYYSTNPNEPSLVLNVELKATQ